MKTQIIFLIIFFISISSYAQKDIVVFTGVNVRNAFSNQKETGFVDYYHNIAINLGVGANFMVVDFLLISPTIEINIFAFPKDSPPGVCITHIHPPKLDISQSANYRFLLELKIISSEKYTRQAYLLTGFGYTIEDVSDIEIYGTKI